MGDGSVVGASGVMRNKKIDPPPQHTFFHLSVKIVVSGASLASG